MKNLLIVVDYQKDFVDGALGFSGAEKLDGAIAARIDEYTGRGDDVVFTLDTHDENYCGTQEGRKLPVVHCVRGTPGWQLYGETAKRLDKAAAVFEKPSFGCAELFDWLRGKDYGEVELCGLVSNICVLTNAALAKTALPEAEVIVRRALTDCADKTLNENALKALEGIQVKVI